MSTGTSPPVMPTSTIRPPFRAMRIARLALSGRPAHSNTTSGPRPPARRRSCLPPRVPGIERGAGSQLEGERAIRRRAEDTTTGQIARRGVTLALPLLDSMFPAFVPLAKAQATLRAPRFVGVFNPHGWEPGHWALNEGLLNELPFILKPLEPWKDAITVISGLDATSSMPPTGETGGDHSRSAAVFSGAQPKKTVSADIRLGITIDQIIAQKYGQDNLLPSLQVKCEDQSSLATCPWGYSCAYVNSFSWSGPNKPLPFEANPQVVFERLFGDGSDARRTDGPQTSQGQSAGRRFA